MGKLILSLTAASILLSGCVVAPYDPVGPGYYRHPHHSYYGPPGRAYRDRDGDGVPNRYDRMPGNPYRY
jgi:hypothetical protein